MGVRAGVSVDPRHERIAGPRVDDVFNRGYLEGMVSLLQWFEPSRVGELWSFSRVHSRPRHYHPEAELNVVTTGSARFAIGGEVYDVQAGAGAVTALCFPGVIEHELISASADFHMWVAYLPPTCSVLDELELEGVLRPLLRPGARQISGGSAAELQELCASALRDPSPSRRRSLFVAIARAFHAGVPARPRPAHPAVRRSIELLWEDPALGRKELAESAKLSESELSRLVHRELGVPLVTHRRRLRVARYLYERASASSQLDAALRAGFGSSAALHRTFLAEAGCGPGAYLRGGAAALAAITRPLPELLPRK